jgi:hypothetical protein
MLTLAATLCLAACGPNAGGPSPVPPSATPLPPSASPVTDILPGSNANPDAQPAIDAALLDAATQLSIGKDQLRVDQVDAHKWPDSSLGCPRPGMMYSQIVTPGFLIVITSASGKRLEYHTDAGAHVVLCKET